jgi:hypothetical protein
LAFGHGTFLSDAAVQIEKPEGSLVEAKGPGPHDVSMLERCAGCHRATREADQLVLTRRNTTRTKLQKRELNPSSVEGRTL